MTDEIKKLQSIIDGSDRIVFFGGAGISTESGIPDFRSADGIYNQEYTIPPEEIVSHDFFMRNTQEFYRFYRDRILFPDAKPNKAHIKLAELEKAGKLQAVITQNIDGLHTDAGSEEVYEIHGSVNRNYCMECGKFYPLETILKSKGVPKCDCGGTIKPDVVLYEEMLDEELIDKSVNAIEYADVLIVGGTSLSVYPAAGFINYFSGSHLVILNRDPTPSDYKADLVIHGKAGEILGQITV